jgi:aromatic-L-amino-acid/L-tryptophan decarboxylase
VPPPEDRTLELTGEALRRLIDAAAARIVAHVDSLPKQPSADVQGGAALARSLAEPLPETGTPAEDLLDLLFERVIPRSFNTAGPGYLAYIPGGGLPQSAVADLVSNATNRYVGVFAAAPGLVQLESNVVRWFCDLAGLPASARGILTSGGSLATFSALVAARRDRLPDDFLSGTIYVSDQTHHAVQKAAILAGFPEDRVREIAVDERFRIRLDALASAIAADRAAGRAPFFLVGNAGTTNTGAIDDLPGLADLAARERLWFHVDAAYGGFFLLTDEGRRSLRGIERADSIVLDPHKGLFLPYGTGALLVRDGETLKRAHALSAEYMPSMQEDADLTDFNLLSPELSRDFRGLRIWLPLRMHGAGPFRRNLEEKLALARWAADRLREMPGIEIVAEPQLSILAFRRLRTGADGPALDRENRRLLERINARKRVYLTGTRVGGRFAIRICVLSFRTHRERMEQALEDIGAAIHEAREAEGDRS